MALAALCFVVYLVLSLIIPYYTDRIGKGADTPADAAGGYLAALQHRDRAQLVSLTAPDWRNDTVITSRLSTYGGLQGSVTGIKDNDPVKIATVRGTLDGKPLAVSLTLTTGAGRWFVSMVLPS